jgi:hypothetical protein
MNLPTFEHNIGKLRRVMGAGKARWDPADWDTGNIASLSEALKRGRSFDLDDLDLVQFEDMDAFVTEDGLRFLVYIREQDGTYKYHLKMCTHLITRREQGTLVNRYVATAQKSDEFNITGSYAGAPTQRAKLDVCRYCLSGIRWRDDKYGLFSSKGSSVPKEAIVRRFHPATYFERYAGETFDSGIPQDVLVAPNQYSTMHDSIANLKKEVANYTCEGCGLNLSGHPKKMTFLNLHHVNGRKEDYSDENLQVLCLKCHDGSHVHSIGTKEMASFKREFGQ